jgi:hypothetical protein
MSRSDATNQKVVLPFHDIKPSNPECSGVIIRDADLTVEAFTELLS